jgi:ABC-type sugar transport system, periplasmic component
MMKRTRTAAIAALGLGVALAASACAGGGSSSGSGSSSSGPVTLTFWTNATPGPGLTYFQNAIKTFDTLHPNVTIKMQTIQNEDYDGKLQTALNSNSTPDIFFQRGGGKMLAMVNANKVQPLTLTAADQQNVSAPRSPARASTARSTPYRSTSNPRGSTTARTSSRMQASPRRRPPSPSSRPMSPS